MRPSFLPRRLSRDVPQRRAARASTSGFAAVAILATALLSPIGAGQLSAAEVHCDLPIDQWETEWLLPFTAPVVVQGKKFSSVFVFPKGAVVLFYDAVVVSEGRRRVTVYLPDLDQVTTFEASHVYPDLPDYEPPDGWMHLGFLFIDAAQNRVNKLSLMHKPKTEGASSYDIRARPFENYSAECVKWPVKPSLTEPAQR